MEKCRYFNNHQTAATLMLDDFALTATTVDGVVRPYNDWGVGLAGRYSLYRYLIRNLLEKFPEIKGSFFYLLQQHGLQNPNAGYRIVVSEDYSGLRKFIRKVSPNFEFAFHGLTHGRYIDIKNPTIGTNWQQEFEYLSLDEIDGLRKKIENAEEMLEIRFWGGKCPGYRASPDSPRIIETLGFKWWVVSDEMMNRRHKDNIHNYIGPAKGVLALPTNISGDFWGSSPLAGRGNLLCQIKRKWAAWSAERYIQYLYENRLVISIQEHYMGIRTDGKRQRPNVYDDINSLQRLYSILRGADVWFATCTEIARYLESYDRSELTKLAYGTYRLRYFGDRNGPPLSACAPTRHLKNVGTGQLIHGVFRSGVWVFNNLAEGVYQELE